MNEPLPEPLAQAVAEGVLADTAAAELAQAVLDAEKAGLVVDIAATVARREQSSAAATVQRPDAASSNQTLLEFTTTKVVASAATTNATPSNTSATAPTAAAPVAQDTTRYDMREEIGSGACGVIRLAYDRQLEREVAIKQLHGNASAEARQRFWREARITGQLEHPNIPSVYELCASEDGGEAQLAMKFVRGKTLETALREPAEEAEYDWLEVFAKVCDAVDYAHDRGVIHRDLKPANIMIGAFGEVMVMDWGLAVARGEAEPAALGTSDYDTSRDALQTLDGEVLGTPAYMAPEQANGNVRDLDARADIYSLGAILYEILTGKPPIAAGDIFHALIQVRGGEIIPPRQRAPERNILPVLDTVTMKALAHDPAKRYPTVSELKRDVNLAASSGRLQAEIRTRDHKSDPAYLLFLCLARTGRLNQLLADSRVPEGGVSNVCEENVVRILYGARGQVVPRHLIEERLVWAENHLEVTLRNLGERGLIEQVEDEGYRVTEQGGEVAERSLHKDRHDVNVLNELYAGVDLHQSLATLERLHECYARAGIPFA